MENRENVEDGICIVSFDGGGPGSMSQLRMLEEFMGRLAFKKKAEVDELLPAKYFDLMGGVGFGGLVALLLGRLRMTTSQAMEELATIGSETFPKGAEATIAEVTMARLRIALESMLERNGHAVGMKLRDTSDNQCKVVFFAAATEVMDHCHPFRTYQSPRKSLECTVVDAACATMATPGYFPSVSIGPRLRKRNFAGIPHNSHNPMREVLKEAKLVFGEKTPVSLMLSLGAGQPARHSGVDHEVTRRTLIHYDGVARDLQDQLHGFAEYLRLNVDKGMENIELDNWNELGSIETYTNVYLEMNQITRYIDRAVQLLLQRNGSVTLGNLSGSSADCVVKSHSESLERYLAMEFKQIQDVVQELGIEKVTLVDAIGKHIPIPKHFCPTYAMLLDVIKVYFRHQKPPGSDLVERGDYRLLHGSSRTIVDPVEWDQLENVRLKVEMSMILRTRNNDKARCPRCRTRSDAPPINGWVTCASCSGQFQIEDQLLEHSVQSGDDEEFHAKENSIVTPAVRESVQTNQERSPTEGNRKITLERELKFRLISVVNLLSKASLTSTGDPLLQLVKYDTVIIVDDSGSMTGGCWREARDALKDVVTLAAQYDTDGIELCFLNSPEGGKYFSAEGVQLLFDKVSPSGSTPTGETLEKLLNDYILRLEQAQRESREALRRIKPVNFLVITDGKPTDNPESVIVSAARRLDQGNFPITQVGIQFLQIGNDPEATMALVLLDDDLAGKYHIRDIVDTTPSGGQRLDAKTVTKCLLGGINRRIDNGRVTL